MFRICSISYDNEMQNLLYTGTAAQEIDRLAINEHGHTGFELMTRAGQATFTRIQQCYPEAQSLLILCGTGNNGGDGYVVGRCALQQGFSVTLVATKAPKQAAAQLAKQTYLDAGGEAIDATTFLTSSTSQNIKQDVIVDALLGVGLTGSPTGESAQLIEAIQPWTDKVIAVDVPSGLNADTGETYQPCVSAKRTVTYIVNKVGLHTGAGVDVCGEVVLENLDLSNAIVNRVTHVASVMQPPVFEQRSLDSHKGSYGHVVIAGGDDGMLGAVLLAATAALRSGAGKVHVMSNQNHLDVPALHCPELMSTAFAADNHLITNCDVLAIGPGLGQSIWSESVFEHVILKDSISSEDVDNKRPLVLDADALNMFAKHELKSDNWVLTPHPAEAARLLGCTTAQIQSDRIQAARKIVNKYGGVCVLKGAGTIVANSNQTMLCDKGNPGMATAGMGDVLTGMIASFIGQQMTLFDAAQNAVWLHAYTADLITAAASEQSLLASDIVNQLGQTFNKLRSE